MGKRFAKEMAGTAATEICTTLGFEDPSQVHIKIWIGQFNQQSSFFVRGESPIRRVTFEQKRVRRLRKGVPTEYVQRSELLIEFGILEIDRLQRLTQLADEKVVRTYWPTERPHLVPEYDKDGKPTGKTRLKMIPVPPPAPEPRERFEHLKATLFSLAQRTLNP
jgi:hypothetical protein